MPSDTETFSKALLRSSRASSTSNIVPPSMLSRRDLNRVERLAFSLPSLNVPASWYFDPPDSSVFTSHSMTAAPSFAFMAPFSSAALI